MYYEGLVRKEIMPMKVKAFLELASMGKYKLEDIDNILYPNRVSKDSGDTKKIFQFLMKVDLIDQLGNGRIKVKNNIDIIINDDNVDIESFKEYFRKVLFLDRRSLFNKMLSELLDFKVNTNVYNTGTDLISNINIKENLDKEEVLAFRFWARFLGYSYRMGQNDFLIINPYTYINSLNEKLVKKTYNIKEYLDEIVKLDDNLNVALGKNEIGLVLSAALKTMDSIGSLRLYRQDDVIESWILKGFTEIDGKRVSHIDLEV